jgi:hypothetical protein
VLEELHERSKQMYFYPYGFALVHAAMDEIRPSSGSIGLMKIAMPGWFTSRSTRGSTTCAQIQGLQTCFDASVSRRSDTTSD